MVVGVSRKTAGGALDGDVDPRRLLLPLYAEPRRPTISDILSIISQPVCNKIWSLQL